MVLFTVNFCGCSGLSRNIFDDIVINIRACSPVRIVFCSQCVAVLTELWMKTSELDLQVGEDECRKVRVQRTKVNGLNGYSAIVSWHIAYCINDRIIQNWGNTKLETPSESVCQAARSMKRHRSLLLPGLSVITDFASKPPAGLRSQPRSKKIEAKPLTAFNASASVENDLTQSSGISADQAISVYKKVTLDFSKVIEAHNFFLTRKDRH